MAVPLIGRKKLDELKILLWLTPEEYKAQRESYCYTAPDCVFCIQKTENVDDARKFAGVYPQQVPDGCNGVNLRKFEQISRKIFNDCWESIQNQQNPLTGQQETNLKEISCAIVNWKMASQHGRGNEQKFRDSWNGITTAQIIQAFARKEIGLFDKIHRIAIATGSTFLRFLFPELFGVIDSNVASYLRERGIVNMNLRRDKYINKTKSNERGYSEDYIPKLRGQARILCNMGTTFSDIDADGKEFQSKFRPCDIEMALFSKITQ